ncbi:FMN-binding protein [Marisediminicola senii]|uniref:FMN-binding protein n=1 Tax=Marisediminicola senii TaxID=2711233 RepID=UPI001F2F495E|nr:hypothetical protein [Marisediminicola senii]
MTHRRTAAIALGGLSLAATLAGCAPTPAESAGGSTGADAATGGSTASEPYADGDYTATGEYQTPGGTESIEVEVTLAGDAIDTVTVTGNATDSTAQRYQGEFIDGIAAEVEGVDIDELAVDKVAGSSLTSDGFNAAIEQIKADALA